MIPGWITFARLRLPTSEEDAATIEVLRDLCSAQADLIRDFRTCLLEEKRIARDAALFAVQTAEQDWAIEAAQEMHQRLADRVARAEEHSL